MNEDIKQNVGKLLSERPVGDITPIGNNGYGKDEAGRLYAYEPIEEKERRRKHAAKKSDNRHFTFSHMRHIRDLTDNLSSKLCGYVLMLQPHIQFKSNVLVCKGQDEVPLDMKELAKVLGVKLRSAKTVIEEMELHDILETTANGNYRVNERYHFRKRAGSEADMLIKTFHTTLKELKISAAEAGFLYKLLPYVHYETNLICDNPFEDDPTQVRFLNGTEIAEKVGIPRQKANAVMLKLNEVGAIAQVQRKLFKQLSGDKRDTLVILNPFIFYRKQGKPDALLMQIFGCK
ncbi:hypothetical protein COJ96_06815 [Bacillus sp. AFS073361]|uniref:hypothetical protein n=1 Tax=Bacillus sp. AFS073361 TaxID=2033511 RepID=UPI000BF97544|nr:hypothetical protein [Bacillus sp. AFS073361]PFP30125.1 hypothetical protein COJ96_06815 [Bacillus sp. AFS073361]